MALAQEDGADAFLLEVQSQSKNVLGELEKLIEHDPVEPVDTGDPVYDRSDRSDFADIDLGRVAFDLLSDDSGDFIGLDVHGVSYPSEILSLICSRCPLIEASKMRFPFRREKPPTSPGSME